MPNLYDKRGLPIRVGDVLKVFHFRAALRREKCYMYKQVIRKGWWGPQGDYFLTLSHLDMTEKYYDILMDEKILEDYEIVQGLDVDFKRRPKKGTKE